MTMTTETRRRRTFGPLLYVTLALGAALTAAVQLYSGGIRLALAERAAVEVSPDHEARAQIQRLAQGETDARREAAGSLGFALLRSVSGNESTGLRAEALAALRAALDDKQPDVAAAAADALGHLHAHARGSAGALAARLGADDEGVRLASARALIRVGGDSDAAIAALAKLLAEPALAPPRRDVVAALVEAGPAGEAAAADVLARMVADPDEDVRIQAADAVPEFPAIASRLRPKLDALLDAPDPGIRLASALAILKMPNASPPTGPKLADAFATAVVDPSRPYSLRERALQALFEVSLPALRRSGLGLAGQLDVDSQDARLAAAALLQQIPPEILAAKPAPPK